MARSDSLRVLLGMEFSGHPDGLRTLFTTEMAERFSFYGMRTNLVRFFMALFALPEGSAVPWHRVINAKGEVSRRAEPFADDVQRELIEAEGVAGDGSGRYSLERYRWRPRT